jgi:hypothetical protein
MLLQDPFLLAELTPNAVSTRTQAVMEGGVEPVWSAEHSNELLLPLHVVRRNSCWQPPPPQS